jgi:hypothetical protein
MRRGVFLSGRAGRTLADDLRRIPRLVLDFVQRPYLFVAAMTVSLAGTAESEGAL